MNLPLVSITITTKNEEKNIKRCLQSIKKQSYKNIEIIVVDNNSVDKTKNIARKFTKKVYNLGPERSAQRNLGMLKKSKGEYLVYLDADMSLSTHLIKNAIYKLENNRDNLKALYIPEIIVGNSFWSKVRNFERSFYNATSIDAVRIIKSNIFRKTKGFDESLTGPEDWDLNKRIKKIGKLGLLAEKKGKIFHHEEFNLLNYLNKKQYYLKSFSKYIKKWDKNDPDIKKQFNPLYRGLLVFIEKNKWIKIVKYPFLFAGIIWLRFLTGLVFIINNLKTSKKIKLKKN
ncbi:glycosyl transferase [Candidatus Beckwithbacteria bacterium CG10_big_fil_rev_8_21_14_0_10_34_10]|uniref:Glycosyl transferase n=1 Tax=Candidatus Beckwithbacteria bacterium CG10_big_fil_rev_8_21_14_0_10_34_10 TaxID=1974495 RepID=A0A2H0W818_9BACT|nr:MAG: glycosyl transferase [Candidatus Beckwithbacteria bacterium CG10_big_fil_rev_8_21_14_0_10_34_10]